MEDNPLLLRLKELEALERLVEKVGRIDLHTGAGGFDALLQNLYRLRAEADGTKAAGGEAGVGPELKIWRRVLDQRCRRSEGSAEIAVH